MRDLCIHVNLLICDEKINSYDTIDAIVFANMKFLSQIALTIDFLITKAQVD